MQRHCLGVKSFRHRLLVLIATLALLGGAMVLTVVSPGSAQASTAGNDYPSRWKNIPMDSVFDDWGEYNRECTSAVAWWLHERNDYEMPFYDNASGWKADAQNHHIVVDSSPAVGAVAWTSTHVAWVEAVSGNNVTVEEYDEVDSNGDGIYGDDGTYSRRTVSGSSFQYIHFKDIDTGGGPDQLLWKLRDANTAGSATYAFYYGADTDIPIIGDWDGSPTSTVTPGIVRRDAQLLWKLRNSNSAGGAAIAFSYGPSTATPVAGDWDGVGITTAGVVRKDDGSGEFLWELRNADGGGVATYTFHYGPENATPIVGDWDGNGTVTPGIVRSDDGSGELLWELRNSNSAGPADIIFHYGPTNAKPVVGDWNGDHVVTAGVVKPYSGQLYWQLRNANSDGAPAAAFSYGADTDLPVVGDWNGDGATTIGIVRK